MIATQRQREIAAQVRSRGGARVSDLARMLGVTEETIRRDLRSLAERGELVRTHGGAVSPRTDDGRADLPYHHRSAIDQPQKRAIAALAASLIEPGQTVALDASSTACELAAQLPNEPLTVVTNSLIVCSILARRDRVTVVGTGGTLDPAALAFHGPQAERAIERHHLDLAVFSCRGVDLSRGLSEASEAHAAVKQRMIDAAPRRWLLADASKFALSSAVYFAPLSCVDVLVTDHSERPAAVEAVAELRARGVEVRAAAVSAAAASAST